MRDVVYCECECTDILGRSQCGHGELIELHPEEIVEAIDNQFFVVAPSCAVDIGEENPSVRLVRAEALFVLYAERGERAEADDELVYDPFSDTSAPSFNPPRLQRKYHADEPPDELGSDVD